MAKGEAVFVEAAARLHFGVLDLRGTGGRWFGGLGASAPDPTVLVSAQPADTLAVTGEDASRAAEFASRVLAHHRVGSGARVHVHRSLPRHAGLGSGTQLALAVARAIAEVHGLPTDARDLARASGRARRSAVGTWTFAGGGIVIEGGRRRDGDDCGPLIARLPVPTSWRCVVAVPPIEGSAMTGAAEEAVFASLPQPPEREVERVAHLVLMTLMPAVADGDLQSFGRALTQVQEITGCWFASVQGGKYARGTTADLIRRMTDWGACGVGQSSWGPTVYGIVEGDAAAGALAQRARDAIGPAGHVYAGPFRDTGAKVWLT